MIGRDDYCVLIISSLSKSYLLQKLVFSPQSVNLCRGKIILEKNIFIIQIVPQALLSHVFQTLWFLFSYFHVGVID